jgi:hypothetical protein
LPSQVLAQAKDPDRPVDGAATAIAVAVCFILAVMAAPALKPLL